MGGGISKDAWRARLMRGVKTFQRKLSAVGIPSTYANLEARGDNFVAYHAGAGPASNGERAAWLVLRVNPNHRPDANRKSSGDIDYTDFHKRDIPEHSKGGIDAGVQAILALKAEKILRELDK